MCKLEKYEVGFPGHIASTGVVDVIRDKIEAIWNAPFPLDGTLWRSLVGLTSSYCRFIKGLLIRLLNCIRWLLKTLVSNGLKRCKSFWLAKTRVDQSARPCFSWILKSIYCRKRSIGSECCDVMLQAREGRNDHPVHSASWKMEIVKMSLQELIEKLWL